MTTFAFMIHPIDPQRDVARRFPILGKLPAGVIDYFSAYFPPVRLSHVTGVRSPATGAEIDGWLIACPMTPNRMLQVSLRQAYAKLVQTGRLAERLGAELVGLGAFTSVVGDAGQTVARRLSIPVTTGNSYTVAVAVEASLKAARLLGHNPLQSTAAVVGAYGSTGRACANLLARSVRDLVLIGRDRQRLDEVQREVEAAGGRAMVSRELDAMRLADIVLTVTSTVDPIVEPEHIKRGAVVCDVARPRNVARRVADERQDVLVIEGGMVDVPGHVDFGFDFGLPPGKAYACMAETMILALEGRIESYSLGRVLSIQKIEEIQSLGARHGFTVSGFRSFERAVSDETIAAVRVAAGRSVDLERTDPAAVRQVFEAR